MKYNTEQGAKVYRWLLVNNQEMCFMAIVKLIDGYYATRAQAEASCTGYGFSECLFRVVRVDDSVVPKWLADKLTQENT